MAQHPAEGDAAYESPRSGSRASCRRVVRSTGPKFVDWLLTCFLNGHVIVVQHAHDNKQPNNSDASSSSFHMEIRKLSASNATGAPAPRKLLNGALLRTRQQKESAMKRSPRLAGKKKKSLKNTVSLQLDSEVPVNILTVRVAGPALDTTNGESPVKYFPVFSIFSDQQNLVVFRLSKRG